jgi:hypothetical protein
MTKRMEHRFEVTFTAAEAPDGRPAVALILNHEGQSAAGQDHTFFLDVDQAIAHEAVPRIAALLTGYVTGFGVMLPLPEETQSQTEPEHGSGADAPRPEAVAEGAVIPDEPETNPEEGQPISPQVDGVNEAETNEPHGGDAGIRGQ